MKPKHIEWSLYLSGIVIAAAILIIRPTQSWIDYILAAGIFLGDFIAAQIIVRNMPPQDGPTNRDDRQ